MRWLLLPETETTICGDWRIRRSNDGSCWEVVYRGTVEVRAVDRAQAARLANSMIVLMARRAKAGA